MLRHKQVKSGIRIGQEIAGFIEKEYPNRFRETDKHFVNAVARYNGIMNDRGDITPEELIRELESFGGEHFEKVFALCSDIREFLGQKKMLSEPYRKASSKSFRFKIFAPSAEQPLKIINQKIYDSAFKNGFPPNFFRESYFDGVVFYCVPDGADFNFSRFNNCQFILCRIKDIRFDGTSFQSTQFHSVEMFRVTFFASSIVHTHIYDSSLSLVSYSKARLKSCNTHDCVMDSVGFLDATLSGCSYGRITANGTRDLDTATITMGGATGEECEKNRALLFNALGVAEVPK
jgi:uncharacterized protein YjbI with pentapeptide repeats